MVARLRSLALSAALLAAACSASPPPPPAAATAAASEIDDPAVRPILEQSCFPCHARERHDPWYGRLVPSSWSSRGRDVLDFSDWRAYDAARRRREIALIAAVVRSGAMPLADYAFVNRAARLDEARVQRIAAWAARHADEKPPSHREGPP